MRATTAGGVLEREAELLVFVRGREEVVGLGVHAAVDAHEHAPGSAPRALDDRREALELDRSCRSRSSRCRPSTALSSSATLLLLPWKPRRAGSAPAARATASSPPEQTSTREALVGDPAHDLGAQERLARVVDARLHAVRLDRRAERGERAARVLAHLVLVDDVQRRAERVAQLRGRDAGDAQDAVVVAVGGCRPHARGERIRIVRRQEPVRGERGGGGQLGPIVERVLRRDCCGRGPGSAGVPRQRWTHAPGGSQKSRARAYAALASRRLRVRAAAHSHTPVLLQRGVGDDRAVDVEVGDDLVARHRDARSASRRRDVLRDADRPVAQHRVGEPAELLAQRGGGDLAAGELQRRGREHDVAVDGARGQRDADRAGRCRTGSARSTS